MPNQEYFSRSVKRICIDLFKKHIKIFYILSLFSLSNLNGYTAIIGGQDEGSTSPFAALVSPEGIATPIATGFTGDGSISSVAINNAGVGIIGGQDGGNTLPFAALVSPEGIVTSIATTGIAGDGFIRSVAINSAGVGIIGGEDGPTLGNTPYAAFVSPEGVATPIVTGVTGDGIIRSVAINSAGVGIIGGEDGSFTTPFAAFVSPEGIGTPIATGIGGDGNINSVAINSTGAGIIGGGEGAGFVFDPYAAVVSSEGIVTPIVTGITADGFISSVAINSAGAGIIGGFDGIIFSPLPYAALVSPGGGVTVIATDMAGDGQINSVAINSAGVGIIGGIDNTLFTPFAALVSPEGVATSIAIDASGIGDINSVAINSAGIGIIGGQDEGLTTPLAALVSPLGVATSFDTGAIGLGGINAVAINSDEILDAVVPGSIGPGNSYVNGLFALSSQILPNHFMFHPRVSNGVNRNNEIGLLTDATESLLADNSLKKTEKTCCPPRCNYAVWGTPFGAYITQDEEENFPELKSWIGGAMIGFDYLACRNAILGIGGAYAYNHVDYSKNLGNARFHQEFLTLYGYWCNNNVILNAALWGGLYQMKNERDTLGIITSKADIDGYLLNPHFEMSTPFYFSKYCFNINPFVMFDWANNWQDSFEETGESGFNINVESLYTSMLRSEVGLRFYKAWLYNCGCVTLETKGSYVNKTPFNVSDTPVFFVGSISTFGIETFSNETQNLGVFQFFIEFTPQNNCYPYCSFNYQGEFGSTFISNLVSIEIGKRF